MDIETFLVLFLREAAHDLFMRGPKPGQSHVAVRFLLAAQRVS